MPLADYDPPVRHRCKLALTYLELDIDDQVTLLDWLNDPIITHSYIGAALRNEGHQVHENTVARHRQRQCLCRVQIPGMYLDATE